MPVTEADLAPGQNLEALTCSICHELFQDPVFAEGMCQCVFCRQCIEQSLQTRVECPLCTAAMAPQTLKSHRWVTNALGALKVKCPNNCAWTGPYETRAHHVRYCPVATVDQELGEVNRQLQANEEERVRLETERQRLQERRTALSQGPPGLAEMPSEGLAAELLQVRATLAAREQELEELRVAARTPHGGAPGAGSSSSFEAVATDNANEDPDAPLKRTLRGILRDLGEGNASRIADRIHALDVSSAETMDLIAREIVQQATTPEAAPESFFAEVIKDLSLEGRMPTFPGAGSAGKPLSITSCTLNHCQGLYESLTSESPVLTAEEREGTTEDQLETVIHQKTLHLLRLIGHLFVQGILGQKIIASIMAQMTPEVGRGPVRDSTVERICQFLSVVGPNLNSTAQKKVMDEVFTRLTRLQTQTATNGAAVLSFDAHFQIQEILRLRNSW